MPLVKRERRPPELPPHVVAEHARQEREWEAFFDRLDRDRERIYTMAANPFVAKLKKQKSAWQAGREEMKKSSSWEDLPPGKYNVELEKVELIDTKKGVRCRFQYRVLQGDYAGQRQSAFDGLETEQNLVHFGRKIDMLGYDPDALEIEEIPELCETLTNEEEKAHLAIRVVQPDNYDGVNVYWDKVYDEQLDDEGPEDDGGSDDGGGEYSAADLHAFVENDDTDGLVALATEWGSDLDADDYAEWSEYADAVAEEFGLEAGDAEPEEEEPEAEEPEAEEESGEDSWEDYGVDADDGDEEAIEALRGACETHELDENDFATWKELGAHVDGLEADDEGAEEVEAEGEGDELEVGMRVVADRRGKEVEGTIQELDEDAQTVKVKPDSGRAFTVSVDAIEILDE